MQNKKRSILYRVGQVAFSDQLLLSEDGAIDEGKEYELINTAKQTDPRYDNEDGFFQYSVEELQEMAKNFNDGIAGIEIAVDLNHDPQKIAYAWIKPQSMYVAPSRLNPGEYSLYAQLHRFTTAGKQMVAEGAVRYFSLQIRSNVKRWINDTKQTFNNVIYGLALTNIPVFKGLSPTFSEQNTQINKNNMDKFVTLLSELEAKNKALTSEERDALVKDFAALSSEDQTTLGDRVYAVIDIEDESNSDESSEEATEQAPAEQADAPVAKEDESVAEGAETTVSDEDKAPVASAEVAAETPAVQPVETPVETEVKASEVNYAERLAAVERELSETRSQNKMLLEQAREVKLSEVADSFVLGSDRKVGFTPAIKGEIVAFMRTLSDTQVSEFQKLFSNIKHVDLKVHGSAAGAPKALTDSEKVAQANAKAKEFMLADKSLSETVAIEKAYRDLGFIQ